MESPIVLSPPTPLSGGFLFLFLFCVILLVDVLHFLHVEEAMIVYAIVCASAIVVAMAIVLVRGFLLTTYEQAIA